MVCLSTDYREGMNGYVAELPETADGNPRGVGNPGR
jgi:hypothetical protein